LASGSFWSLVGAVLSHGFSLLAGIMIARILGKVGFGLWGLVVTTVTVFAQFASFGVALTATKHVAELKKSDPSRAGRTLSLILLVGLISTTLMAMVCLMSARWLANHLFNVPKLGVSLMFASVMLIGTVGTLTLQGALAGFEDFRRIARINLVQGVVLFIAAVPLTWQLGLNGAVIAMSLSQCTAMVLCVIATIKKSREYNMPLGTEGIWRERRILWHYAVPSLLSGLTTGPAMMLSQAIVTNISGGLAGLGGFQAAARWRDIVLFVPGAVRRVTLPMLSRLKGENEYHRFVKALWANIALNGGIALAGAVPVMILSPWLMGLYGANFRQDWDIMVILVASGIFQAVNDVVTQVTTCMEKMWWQFAICMVWGVTLLGGSYLMVPVWGIKGYVWSTVFTTVSFMALNCAAAAFFIKKEAVINQQKLHETCDVCQ
jgi:O-antigen/teichoic acid export membrane protein